MHISYDTIRFSHQCSHTVTQGRGFYPTPSIQQPQPRASKSQLLSQLTSQPTGFAARYIPPQPIEFLNQSTGFGPQPISAGQQQNKLQQNPQASSYSDPRLPMPPLSSNSSSNVPLSQTEQSFNFKCAATGWTCQKNEPKSNVSNLNMALPYGRNDRRGQLSVIHYKESTEDLMPNDVAIYLMAQGGLPPNELVAIYNLSAIGNRDKISMPEFSVATHIINRRINDHPVPNQFVRNLVTLHKTMGNPINWIEHTPWRLATFAANIMRDSCTIRGDPERLMTKCSTMATQFQDTFLPNFPIKCRIHGGKGARESVAGYELVHGLLSRVPPRGAVILVSDGLECICSDVAHRAEVAEKWSLMMLYLAIRQQPHWIPGRLEIPRDETDNLDGGWPPSPPTKGYCFALFSLPRLLSVRRNGEDDIHYSY